MNQMWFWLVIGALSVGALACGGGDDAGPSGDGPIVINTPTVGPTRIAVRTATPTATGVPTKTPLTVCGTNPDPALPKLLQIEEPAPEQEVKVPIHVRGWGSTIGANNGGVAVAIVNAKQEIVQVLNLPPQPNTYRLPPVGLEMTADTRPFAADVVIQNIKEPTPFCIWAYQETTQEGQPKGVIQGPVAVLP